MYFFLFYFFLCFCCIFCLSSSNIEIREEKMSPYKSKMLLTIKKFSEADDGTYSCISTNTYGKMNKTIKIYGTCWNSFFEKKDLQTTFFPSFLSVSLSFHKNSNFVICFLYQNIDKMYYKFLYFFFFINKKIKKIIINRNKKTNHNCFNNNDYN